MTVRERVAAYLRAKGKLHLCDECLGRALQIHPASAYRAAAKLADSRAFIREHRTCSRCGTDRFTTGASS